MSSKSVLASTNRKLVLIDAMAILHRAYHAMPPLTTLSGEPIGAIQGFVSMLLRIVAELEPTHIVVAFDCPEPTFRKEILESYQSQRPEVEEALTSQFEKAKVVLDSMNIVHYEKVGYEADDIIGTIANQCFSAGEYKSRSKKNKNQALPLSSSPDLINSVVIVTGDKDQLQLVNDKVSLFMPQGSLSNAKLFGPKEVKEKMGVTPSQIIDYKALMGDPSDNYKGVSGIGPKTATSLLLKYKTLEGIYKNIGEISENIKNKLESDKEGAFQSQKLAKIVTNVPFNFDLSKADKWDIGGEKVDKLFEKYGFRTLRKRIENFKNSRTQKLQKNSKFEDKTYKTKLTKEEVEKVAVEIAKKLEGKQYAIRGTASLVLQGLDMVVDDIDIVADKKTALEINEIFKNYLLKKVKLSETEKYKSYFGQFVIDNILLEIMGDFQVKKKDDWTEFQNANKDQKIEIKIENKKVFVTKIDLELQTSADMGRWNEFHKIKKQITERNQQSLFLE